MSNMDVKTNGLKAWFLAARPKTLAGAVAPVLVGGSMAFSAGGQWQIFILCLLFAVFMQIDANFINDYFDFKKGTDREDRLGPERACAQGWITPSAMMKGIILTTILSCLIGLAILFLAICEDGSSFANSSDGWQRGLVLMIVGILCVVFCFLYTTKLSYLGLGDVLVLVFFGLVPVIFTHYVMTHGEWSLPLVIAGLAMGVVTDNLLMVNNYRDRYQDKVSGKRTIIVRIIDAQINRLGTEKGQKEGEHICQLLYLWIGIIAVLLGFFAVFLLGHSHLLLGTSLFVYFTIHLQAYRQLQTLDGKELNTILGATARNIFLFGLLLAISLL